MDVVNAEWALTYDKTKLELDTVRSKDYMPNIPNEVTSVKKADGKVLSNFTDIDVYKRQVLRLAGSFYPKV